MKKKRLSDFKQQPFWSCLWVQWAQLRGSAVLWGSVVCFHWFFGSGRGWESTGSWLGRQEGWAWASLHLHVVSGPVTHSLPEIYQDS